MTKFHFIFHFLFLIQIASGQTNGQLIIKSSYTKRPLKNVNILIPSYDTVLVTDTSGIVNISESCKYDSLVIKKFGYIPAIIDKNTKQIVLIKDSTIYSNNLKLLDLKFKDGYSFIKLRINDAEFWFKQ
jgi:hypothetical protein